MNLKIPFTKEIEFKGNIASIVSISLEHDYTINDSEVLGNFIVSGEYKTHEVSVNKEHFEFCLPFSVSLPLDIDTSTLEFNILDFTYELKDKNTLVVNIEYNVNASKLEVEDNIEVLEEKRNIEEVKEEDRSRDEEEIKKVKEEVEDNEVIKNINKEDEYMIYNIHIYKESDTIESICLKYNTTEDILKEYNDITNLSINDKLIIPDSYE